MPITLEYMPSRLGSNILFWIASISYAINNNIKINYNIDSLIYGYNIFTTPLLLFVNYYNSTILHERSIDVPILYDDFFNYLSLVVLNIKSDLISFFRENLFNYIKPTLYELFRKEKYELCYDPTKTIVVHLRLDDVANRSDFDGKIPSDYYINKINNDTPICRYDIDVSINMQTPLSIEKIRTQIERALEIYEGFDVLIIASSEPKDYIIDLPYRIIRNNTPEYDLFLLCNAKVLILSRSTFALIGCLLGNYEKAFIPLWGLFVGCGLGTKYDKTDLSYFY
jgi:hypothetical protein